MAEAALSIKLRCASWQQLATIYKRDLSRGTMFLKAATPPAIGTRVRIDLTLPSASVIALSGIVSQHVSDPTRGTGVDLKLDPLPSSSVWLIESALAAETKVRADSQPGAVAPTATPSGGVPTVPVVDRQTGPLPALDNQDVASAELELITALMSEAESLRKLNPFLVLGVGYEASDADVRAAFGELTKRYHPDRFARYESADLRKVAAEIFILIRDAYRKLSDETSRAQVLVGLGKQSPPRAVPVKRESPPPTKLTGRMPTVPVRTEPGVIPGSGRTPPLGTPITPAVTSSIPISPATEPTRTTPPPIPRPGLPRPPTPPPIPSVANAATAQNTTPVPPKRSDASSPGNLEPRRDKPEARSTPGNLEPRRDKPEARSQPGFGPRTPPDVTTPMQPSQPIPVIADTQPTVSADVGRPATTSPIGAAEAGDSSAFDSLLDAGKFDEAVAAYKLLSKKHPADRTYRAGLELVEGLRALAQRDRLEAAQRFEAALEIDPSNERAARELAEMRRQATNERKGMLSRLMGKKE
jgi:hypothetical protein